MQGKSEMNVSQSPFLLSNTPDTREQSMDYSSSFRRNDSELKPREPGILNAQYADLNRYPGVRAKEGQLYVNTELRAGPSTVCIQ